MNAEHAAETGNQETVEQLLRYAAHRFDAAGVTFKPAKMSRLVRSALAVGFGRGAIDAYLADRASDASWRGFELFVSGYADPTGAHAMRNVAPGVSWRDDEDQWAVSAIVPRRIGESVESVLDHELWNLVEGKTSLHDYTPALQAWWTVAFEEGRRSAGRDAHDALRFSRDLWYYVANNPGKRPSDFYARCTDQLWLQAVAQ